MNALSISNVKPSYDSNIYVEQSVQKQFLDCGEGAIASNGKIMDSRWSLWHILKKLPEKFRNHDCEAYILSTVHDVVYESQSPGEFE